MGDPMYIFLPKYLKRSLYKAHFPSQENSAILILLKERHFICIYSRVYINEGKDRVMVMQIENFTKPLYWVLVMNFFKLNIFKIYWFILHIVLLNSWPWENWQIGINGLNCKVLEPLLWRKWPQSWDQENASITDCLKNWKNHLQTLMRTMK